MFVKIFFVEDIFAFELGQLPPFRFESLLLSFLDVLLDLPQCSGLLPLRAQQDASTQSH